MKRLLLILIITLSFHSLTKADDISDFEIEGISVGDSLLEFFNTNTIKAARKYDYDNDKFYTIDVWSDKFIQYDGMQFHLKKNDTKYKIYGFAGALTFGDMGKYYPESENECKKQKNIIIKDIDEVFLNADKRSHSGIGGISNDPSVIRHDTYYSLENGSVWLQCYTFSKIPKKKDGLIDNLRTTILSLEFQNWMSNKAYK